MFDYNLILISKDLGEIRSGIRKAFKFSQYRKDFVESVTFEEMRYKKDGEPYKKPLKLVTCKSCNCHFTRDKIDVDHIEEVGYFYSFEYVEVFIRRVFCDYGNLQILCKDCHKGKRLSIKGYKLL